MNNQQENTANNKPNQVTEFTEGAVTINNESAEIVSKDLPVFYNPVMKHNRDMTLLMLKAFCKTKIETNNKKSEEKNEQSQAKIKKLQSCDLMAGSGIRSLRLLAEAPEIIEHITINDKDGLSVSRIKTHLKKEKIHFETWSLDQWYKYNQKLDAGANRKENPLPKVVVSNIEGSLLLLAGNGYDYIDIDPFGSPNQFLDAAMKRMSRGGILAVTATDTSALAGSYPEACVRKYWGNPCDGPRKHEVGLRLFVRKIQLVGAQHEKAAYPLLTYVKDHYYRAFFLIEKGKLRCDELLAQHGIWDQEPNSGPLFLGKLSNPEFIDKITNECKEKNEQDDYQHIKEFLSIIKEESSLEPVSYFYHLNDLNKELGSVHKKEKLLAALKEKGARSHIEGNAIRSELSAKEIQALLKKA